MNNVHLESEERVYVDALFYLDQLLQFIEEDKIRYGVTGSEARLYISTCRNNFLTVNAIFADVKTLLERQGQNPSPLAQLRSSNVLASLKSFDKVEKVVVVAQRAALEKLEVWRRSAEIHPLIFQAIEECNLRTSEKDALSELLTTTATVLGGDPVENPVFIELNPVHLSSLDVHLRVLKDVLDYSGSLLALTRSVRKLGLANVPDLLGQEASVETWNEFFLDLAKVAVQLGGTSGTQEVTFVYKDKQIILSKDQPDHSSLLNLLQSLEQKEKSYCAEILEQFPRNVAKRAMPSIFPMILPFEQAVAGNKSSSGVSTRTIDLSCGQMRDFSVGCPNFGMPLDWYEKDKRSFTAEGRRLARRLLTELLQHMRAERRCELLLLPEYFVPAEMCESISTFCREQNVIAVYGLEARNSTRKPGAIQNHAIVDFSCIFDKLPPDLRSNQGRIEVSKCFPSKFEPKLDSPRNATVIRQTPVGSFAVVICSDLMEHNVVKAIHDCPTPLSAVFVLAMNPSPGIFAPLAQADATRLHCPVLVSSNCVDLKTTSQASCEGTGIATPTRSQNENSSAASTPGQLKTHSAHVSSQDWTTVNYETAPDRELSFQVPAELCTNGKAGLLIFDVRYDFMNDLRTHNLSRKSIPPSHSAQLDS